MIVDTLTAALGPDVVIAGPDIPARNRQDWSGLAPVEPLALLRPRTTAEISTALRLCHESLTPVVTQGGLSGLCGGALPLAHGVALSLERMTHIHAVDPVQATLTAEAGCILQSAQTAAAGAGMLLAVDLGGRGSCTLGGIISTNAGGNQVLRYGMTRDHVLGLEVVLADGTILPAMNSLLKNNIGVDLKQLFIGSEGLLGVITQAVFRLLARPTQTVAAFCGLADTDAVLAFLAHCRAALGPVLTSFEVMWPSFYDPMRAGINAAHPLEGAHGAYAIVEAGGFDDSLRDRVEATLAAAMEAGLVQDAVLAGSLREERALWAVREAVAQYPRIIGPMTAFDIGIPMARMAEAVAQLQDGVATRWPGALALCYGHMGDSNLHFVVHVPGDRQPGHAIKDFVYDLTRDLGGTVSAEHGIGLLKRDWLGHSRSLAEIATMRALKAALDPHGILNPGKGFSA